MTIKIKNIITDAKNKYWFRFLVNGIIMFAVIVVFYEVLRKNDIINTFYVDILNSYAVFLLDSSANFIRFFGYEVITYGKTIKIIDNLVTTGVYLDRGCMGRNVMLAFAAMIFILPGKIKHKIWYIPLGLIILIFVNILRISGLAIIYKCCPEHGDINHYFVFKIAAWSVIFLLWAIWINKFIIIKKKKP